MGFVMCFLTLSIKSVNVITGCERLQKLNRSFSFLIVHVDSTNWDHLFLTEFWFNGFTLNYVNTLGEQKIGNPWSEFASLAVWTYLKYKLETLIIKCLPLMIIFVHVHQVISELWLAFPRKKSPPVLGNYTFNSTECNGKMEWPTSTFTLLTNSRQVKFWFCDEQPKVK